MKISFPAHSNCHLCHQAAIIAQINYSKTEHTHEDKIIYICKKCANKITKEFRKEYPRKYTKNKTPPIKQTIRELDLK